MKIKKMVVAGVLAASLICMQNLSVSANNWSDTSFSVKYSGDGSEDIVTSARAKQDSSASYNNNGGSNTTDINVCVYGVKNNTYNVMSAHMFCQLGRVRRNIHQIRYTLNTLKDHLQL